MKVHIGKHIAKVLDERGITKRKFAQLINMGERNLYELFKRDTIDTGKLEEISRVLNYNFFKLYDQGSNPDQLPMEETEQYKTSGINLTFHFDGADNDERSKALLQRMNDLLAEFLSTENQDKKQV